MKLIEIIQDIPILLACILCIAGLVQIFIIFFIERTSIVKDLKGKDKIWQFIELTGIVWLVLFPIVVVCGIILAIKGTRIPVEVWASMDAIYFMNLGGRFGKQYLDKRTEEKPHE